MYTDKPGIQLLVQLCALKGIRHAVLSPGSRNAPLTIALANHPDIACYSISDERSAAFFALGIARQLQQPVVITCTSGSAGLNYAPAIAEAFYQKVPLLVLTADRPEEWTDQGDGQTIRQHGMFENYIRKSFRFPQEVTHQDDAWYAKRIASEAIDTTTFPTPGPVHINLPLREPLYGRTQQAASLNKWPQQLRTMPQLAEKEFSQLTQTWNRTEKKLLIAGQMLPNKRLNEALNNLAGKAGLAVMTETTSNVFSPSFLPCIDRLVNTMTDREKKDFQPELLVTIGDAIVSKMVKAYLRNHQPKQHWHISATDGHLDTFQNLTHAVPMNPEDFLEQLSERTNNGHSTAYLDRWKDKDRETDNRHKEFLQTTPWSDLKTFECILEVVPKESNLHLGNSTPIRYAQLFRTSQHLRYEANRGTSGIDGCTSTAAGAALVSQKPTTLITGDVGFFYDSNAFWNNHLSPRFRVIVINNGGGGIFRIISGPGDSGHLEQFFETRQRFSAKGIAQTFALGYSKAENEEELKEVLVPFFNENSDRPKILEVFTPQEENPKVLKSYFDYLRGQEEGSSAR